MAFRLRISDGKAAGRSFVFSQSAVRIGRMPDNDLVLYDPGVSRYHCRIIAEGEQYSLLDDGSANGTLLNSETTTEAVLDAGDQLTVGPITFTFERLAEDSSAVRDASAADAVFLPSSATRKKEVEEQQTKQLQPEQYAQLRAALDNPQPHAEPTGQPRRRWDPRGWGRTTRLAVLASAAAVMLVAVIAAGLLLGRRPPDRSGELFVADGQDGSTRFGAGNVDVYTPDRANFRFSFAGGHAEVSYGIGGADRKEVRLLLNGKPIGYAPASPDEWTLGVKKVLPRAHLRRGTNILTFDNVRTPKVDERWGVAQVVVREEALAQQDPQRARELLQLGKEAFDARKVAPQNLVRALDYFQRARRHVEALQPQPTLVETIDAHIAEAHRAQQQIYESHVFAAEKAVRFGNLEEAKTLLLEVLEYIPNAKDTRHRQAKRRLRRLTGRSD